ncbi:MAG: NAD(P)H-hydrate dehydratase [Methanosarcinaceae archaeon]|nr:NAD(P)H-hydrate dehydratase [Methanosarcinaceae archaeon]
MKYISSSRMRTVDKNCAHLGLLPLQLMENAGGAIARSVRERLESGQVLFVAGRGNNGGDAFVAARHLAGIPAYEVRVLLLGKAPEIRTEEAGHNFRLLEFSGVRTLELRDSSELSECSWFSEADFLVDAIFGTGVKGKIREPESKAIDLINEEGNMGKPVLSVDIPSGLDPDGDNFDKAIRADLTLTFHCLKTGLTGEKAKEFTGDVQVADIGICAAAETFVGPGDLQVLYRRRTDSHKGAAGKVLVLGGGPYSGAPALAALAAYRAGADLVTAAVPKSVSDTVASFSPNLIVRKLSSETLCPEDLPLLRELVGSHDVLVLGMGLGKARKSLETVRKLLPFARKAVLDAEALSALSPAFLQTLACNCELVLTPHAGEFERLLGEKAFPISSEESLRIKAVREFSEKNGVVTLLKGKTDIISDGEQTLLNRTGNAGMTVGGTGDVLAGLTGALFALNPAFLAASCAAYINGEAGDLAFREFGYGLLATDVLEKIPAILKAANEI